MAGLARILKQFGSASVNGVKWIWDYASDKPRIESEMTKEEKKASDKAKYKIVKDQLNSEP